MSVAIDAAPVLAPPPPPPVSLDVATRLRVLEQDTKKIPNDVRSAMLDAAQEIDDMRDIALRAAAELEAVAAVRVSVMESESASIARARLVQKTLAEVAASLRTLLA